MNWYKISQKVPIMISSYIGNQMGILFNGRGPYYYMIEEGGYREIEYLLRKRNYKKVEKILRDISSPKKEKNQQMEFDFK